MVSAPPSLAALAGLLLPALASAHGSISVPTVVFDDVYNKNAPSALVPGTPGQYTGSAVLRDLADQAGSTCGNTDGGAAAQPAPADGRVVFDISAVHIGPCELWLGDAKAASARDCWATYPDKAIPVDFSLCAGGHCRLRWVWLATHNDPWEIFDNCVNINVNVGGSSSGNSSTTAPAAITTAAPAKNTAAPVVTTTTAPVVATVTTAPTAPAAAAAAGSGDDTPGTVAPADTSAACSYRGAGGQTQLDAWCEANCAMNYCPEDYCEADC